MLGKSQEKIKIALIIALLIELILIAYNVCHIRFSNQLEVKTYKPTYITIPPVEQTLTKDTANDLINDLFNTPHIYIESDLANTNIGVATPMYRVVQIQKGLNLHNYIISYAHELTHVKYQVGNETYTAYQTFVLLYESGNAELRYHALVYANDVLSGGYVGTNYDVGYYILKYLKGENT